MADKTIAYSHRENFWKTRYTFFSSCYAFVDRCFVSFNKQFSASNSAAFANPIWKHDTNNQRTSFYGNDAAGSGIAVTFNTNPSQNKLYKALSLESTNNVQGVTAVLVNNSSVPSQVKNVATGVLTEKGGIMYGHIGKETIASGCNVRLVGRISTLFGAVEPLGGNSFEVNLPINFVDGGKSNLHKTSNATTTDSNPGTKFFLVEVTENNPTGQFFSLPGLPLPAPVSYAGFPNYVTLLNNSNQVSNTTSNTISLFFNAEAIISGEGGDFNIIGGVYNDFLINVITDPNRFIYLYSVSPESVNGEDPKGQTADAVVTLGSAPYELYALNLDYVPTNLDHRE